MISPSRQRHILTLLLLPGVLLAIPLFLLGGLGSVLLVLFGFKEDPLALAGAALLIA